MSLFCLVLVITGLTSCMKVIATEDDLFDDTFHKQAVGTSARELLSDEKFTALRIEIQYMQGFLPDETAIENLEIFLTKHLHKPGGIRIVMKEIEPVRDSVLGIKEIRDIEKANRTTVTSRNEISVYILYTNGFFKDPGMLGYAYLNTSAVLFGKNIAENAKLNHKADRTYLETRVLQHEMGHLLGLVNVGSSPESDHQDHDHGKHCKNRNCLMYYLTDTEESPSFVKKKTIPKLDKACLKDLKANGGK